MEPETVAFEANTSVRHEVNHMSMDANGESNLEQSGMQQQDQDMSDRGTSPEEEEEETTKDKKMVIVNGQESDGVVNYGFIDLEEEEAEWASHEGFSSIQHEDVDKSGDGEGGITVRTTLVTTISKHVERPVAKIEVPDSLNEQDEQEQENDMEELSYLRNDKQATGEPLHEDSPVVIEKKTVSHHTESITFDVVSSESKKSIEDNVTVEVQNVPMDSINEKDPIEEDSPIVVEKRPTSLHLEAELDQGEGDEVREAIVEGPPEIIKKSPGSVHMEQVLNEEGSSEIREPIEEASAVAQESEPRLFHYHPMLEENVEELEDDKVVDVNNVEMEKESIIMEPEKRQETETEPTTEPADTRNVIAEESPFVVEKLPVSLHMEAVFDHEENQDTREEIMETFPDVIEKRPVSLNMEQVFNEEQSSKFQQIEETSAVAVELEPRLLEYHPMLEENVAEETVAGKVVDDISVDVKNVSVPEEPEEEGKVRAEQITGAREKREEIAEEEPVVVEKTPVSLHLETTFDHEESGEVRQTIEEASPEVIERRPVSFHMEDMFHGEERTDVQEPMEEASAVALESEPRLLHYHPMLEENVEEVEEAKDIDDSSMEVSGESVVMEPEKGQETTAELMTEYPESSEVIAEESPFVIEKRPVSLHMEAAFEHEKSDEARKTVEEASPEVIEKGPVSLDMEHVFHEEESTEVREPIEEASAVAVESEPGQFHYHSMLEEKVEELVENKHDDDSSVEVGDVLVGKEPGKGQGKETEQAAELSETRDVIVEESPLLVEKRPVSLHLDTAFDHEENPDIVKPIDETPPEIVEKRPVLLNMEHVFHEEENTEVREPIEEASATAIESEPRSFSYHPILEEKVEEPVEHENADEISIELAKEPKKDEEIDTEETNATLETTEVIAEDSPTVVEKQPVSLHMDTVFDHKEDVRMPIEEASPEIIEKKSVSLPTELVFHEEKSADVREPIEEASAVVVESESRLFHYHPMLEEKEQEQVEDNNVDDRSVELAREPEEGEKIQPGQSTEIKEAITEESPLVIEKRPVSLQMESVFDHGEDHEVKEPVEEVPPILIQKKATELNEPVAEAELVVIEKKPAPPQPTVLFEQGSPDDELIGDTKEDNDATVESLLINIESIIEKPPPEQMENNEKELTWPSDKEPIEEDAAVKVEKRAASLNMESLLDPEMFREKVEEASPVPQEKRDIVDEVVTDIVVKKPISCALYDEQKSETKEKESVYKEEPPSIVVLDIPQGEKRKEGEDFVQETAAPVVETKALEFHHELLEPVETEERKPKEFDVDHSQQDTNNDVQETKHTEVVTTTTSVVTSKQSTGEEPTQESETIAVTKTFYERKTMEVASSSTNSLPNTVTTEETFSSTSYTKQFQEGDMVGEGELLRYVLRKRLSAPEILPEKESEGSAPLAASEDRGILESQEQFNLLEKSRKLKDSTSPKTTQGADESGVEPYEDVPDEEKLIPDSPGEVEFQVSDSVEKEEGADETLPVLMLLTPEDEAKQDQQKKRKKGKKGELSSPQCKCCSLM